MLALLGAYHIFHVGGLRVNQTYFFCNLFYFLPTSRYGFTSCFCMGVKLGPSSWFSSAYIVFVFSVLGGEKLLSRAMGTERYNETIISRIAGTSENSAKEGRGVASNWAIGGGQNDRLLVGA